MSIYHQFNTAEKQQRFIRLSNLKHNNQYDYSLVVYQNNYTKVKIICPVHGIFEQRPDSHVNTGSGCLQCSHKRKQPSNNAFIKKCIERHGNKYDYSLVDYINSSTNVTIICPKHGEFKQIAKEHKGGAGCTLCSYERLSGRPPMKRAEFIFKCQLVHKDTYDYSVTEYEHSHKSVSVNCPKHGVFKIRATDHLQGGKCKRCKTSKGEQRVYNALVDLGVNFVTEHSFPDCVYIRPLRFDFYLPQYNMCIEYDGSLHFKPRNPLCEQSIKDFEYSKIRDNIKDTYCLNNNIRLLRIPFTEIKQINSIVRSAVGC